MYTYPRPQDLAYPARVLSHRGALANVTDAGQDAVNASSVRRGVERQGGFLTEEPVSGETGTLTTALQADGEDVWSRCPAWHQVPMRAPKPGPRTSSSVTTATKSVSAAGEQRDKPLKPLRAERWEAGVSVVTNSCALFFIACEAAGALGARRSLRPL
jgi:hypothetical protein